MVIDCTAEFRIRQDVNFINRYIDKLGFSNRVVVLLEEDANSETGIVYNLFDKATNETKKIDLAAMRQ